MDNDDDDDDDVDEITHGQYSMVYVCLCVCVCVYALRINSHSRQDFELYKHELYKHDDVALYVLTCIWDNCINTFLIIITIIISTTTPSTDTIYNDVMCDLIEIRKEWIRFACKEKTLYRNRRQFIM